jgi:CarboxypepD_reg-like domain
MHFSIPTPCHENWDAMIPKQNGRHCQACNKVVVDFTSMNDYEVLNYLNRTKGDVCGHVYTDQLAKPVQLKKKLKLFLYALASVFLLTTTPELIAQTSNSNSKKEILKNTNDVCGQVVDENGRAVPFVLVTLSKDTKINGGAKTDNQGQFIFKNIPFGRYIMKVSYAGYQEINKNVVVSKNYSEQQIELVQSDKSVVISSRRIDTSKSSNNRIVVEGLMVRNYVSPADLIETVASVYSKKHPADSVINKERLSGKIINENGHSMKKVTIKIWKEKKLIAQIISNKKGEFNIDSLAYGKYILVIHELGYEHYEQEIEFTYKPLIIGGPPSSSGETIILKKEIPPIDPTHLGKQIITEDD